VLDNQVVRLSALQDRCDIVQQFGNEIGIHSVHDGDLLVQDHIGIVCHAVGDNILALEQVNPVIVNAYIADILGNMHNGISFDLFF
jgi:hypothetical protein